MSIYCDDDAYSMADMMRHTREQFEKMDDNQSNSSSDDSGCLPALIILVITISLYLVSQW